MHICSYTLNKFDNILTDVVFVVFFSNLSDLSDYQTNIPLLIDQFYVPILNN